MFYCRNATGVSAQETILQAVSLVRSDMTKANNEMQKQLIQQQLQQQAVTVAVVDAALQQQQMPIAGVAAGTVANIPQELTIMSDNDLLRYINPSCFDTGTFYIKEILINFFLWVFFSILQSKEILHKHIQIYTQVLYDSKDRHRLQLTNFVIYLVQKWDSQRICVNFRECTCTNTGQTGPGRFGLIDEYKFNICIMYKLMLRLVRLRVQEKKR